MPFFQDVIVAESIEIKTTPEDLFNYLTGIVDNESFKTLNANNVSFRWVKGRPKEHIALISRPSGHDDTACLVVRL